MHRRANRSFWGTRYALSLVAAALVYANPALAEPDAAAAPSAGGAAVPLDKLLRLPPGTSVESKVERRGGQTRAEWQTRFRQAHEQRAETEAALEQTRSAIEEKAAKEGGQWRMTAPGLGAAAENTDTSKSPLDYRLTQELRRNREELARADRHLQDLMVEANLASVPREWRDEPEVEAAQEPEAAPEPAEEPR